MLVVVCIFLLAAKGCQQLSYPVFKIIWDSFSYSIYVVQLLSKGRK